MNSSQPPNCITLANPGHAPTEHSPWCEIEVNLVQHGSQPDSAAAGYTLPAVTTAARPPVRGSTDAWTLGCERCLFMALDVSINLAVYSWGPVQAALFSRAVLLSNRPTGSPRCGCRPTTEPARHGPGADNAGLKCVCPEIFCCRRAVSAVFLLITECTVVLSPQGAPSSVHTSKRCCGP